MAARHPFGLSLSKPRVCQQHFDRLSANGANPFGLRYRSPMRALASMPQDGRNHHLCPNGRYPFALSPSKGRVRAQGFDKLSLNGGERRPVC
jgi:hypothetical protein